MINVIWWDSLKIVPITILKNLLTKSYTFLFQTALAHLESLAVDVEVANPPASKESIDGLPETLVLEDHTGKAGQHSQVWDTILCALMYYWGNSVTK